MLGDIRIKSLFFVEDDVVVWYNLEVGENSQATCSVVIPDHVYKELGTDKELLNYIKKEDIMEKKKPDFQAHNTSAVVVGTSSFWVRLWNLISNPFRYLFTGEVHY